MNSLDCFANQVVESCHSTNDIAKSLGEAGYPHGTWISAIIQEGGRGRLGRKWESIRGNLFLSILVRLNEVSLSSWVPLATGVAVSKSIESQFPLIQVGLKWPNDIWVKESKLGGILCEGVSRKSNTFIVIGIGLNCVGSPSGIDQSTTDLSSLHRGSKVDADRVRIPILESVLLEIAKLERQGPDSIRKHYDNRAVFSQDSWVQWGEPPQLGKVIGLGTAGELEVFEESGVLRKLYAEEVKVRQLILD